ncbi:efflux RND transporter periplasmic adaptor subunit [Albibacterium bauzanense]|uniref:Multidrug efflux pump subunit AcrA (Membrane-fusion protein) n=1 Tax=Albibacterium bauzanense TaxID=653929 RepID=A0A4R1M2Q8_9SPHI|nr:efflux RND transporter periplasmic adaptor subunit [Albibacterium bauzanense]TCK85717.1 multidrug efflux pump subunit AcrA (membrane-fusion protein) [Albibacterium bauzanense]
MKKNYLGSLFTFLCIIFLASSCKQKVTEHTVLHSGEELSDDIKKSIQLVNGRIVSQAPVIYADSGSKVLELEIQGRIVYDTREKTMISSRVAGRIEKLNIKYNYQPVRKGQLIMEVYSPDLVAAQRELLFLQNGDSGDVKSSAMKKLLYLGMSQSQIDRVLKSGTPEYRVGVYSPVNGFIVENGSSTTMDQEASAVMVREGQYLNAGESVFTVYGNSGLVAEFSLDPGNASLIKKDQRILFSSLRNPDDSFVENVDLIQPIFREGENFTLVRIYVPSEGFIIGEMLQAKVPIFIKNSLWLPQSSVIDLGMESVVFVKEGDVFVPKKIEVGAKVGGLVQVLTAINEWEIAEDASYLMDSESFIALKESK